MGIGTSLFLIAVGAVLRWAVTANLSWIDINTVGTVLLVVGVIGLLLSIAWIAAYRDRRVCPVTAGTPDAGSRPVSSSYVTSAHADGRV